jgi:hypothetical protein
VRFIWLFCLMLLVYVLAYLFWGIVWYIVNETSNCVGGVGKGSFLASYIFSLETQVRRRGCAMLLLHCSVLTRRTALAASA